jgi:hypothetical protein
MRTWGNIDSNFLDPIVHLENDVLLVRPFMASIHLRYTTSTIEALCEQKLLPHVWDGERYLVFIDSREVGNGGKFSLPKSTNEHQLVATWKDRSALLRK